MTFQRIFYDALDNSYEILRFALARTFSSNNADLLSVNTYKLSTKEIKYKNRLTTNLNIDLYIYQDRLLAKAFDTELSDFKNILTNLE